jgi:anti-sigma regulatory factor (Ser/Thr protein kinase)
VTERSFSSSREAVRDGRHFIASELAGVADEVRDAACLLGSELCTNALVHGGRGFTVRVLCLAEAVHVSVTDPGGGVPRPMHPSVFDVRGRGLELVAALADRWGVEPTGTGSGKTVWLEIDLARHAVVAEGETAAPVSGEGTR